MDSASAVRDNPKMARAGAARADLAQTLNAAYGAGLISENTLAYRLDVLFSGSLIEPGSLIGDISRRPSRDVGLLAGANRTLRADVRAIRAALDGGKEPGLLLTLDWHGGCEHVAIGRDPGCDVVLFAPEVSRHHAALRFRDGCWILQDLDSRNGTRVNGERVQRCELRPGDLLRIGGTTIRLD
jgi:hypothetical protein